VRRLPDDRAAHQGIDRRLAEQKAGDHAQRENNEGDRDANDRDAEEDEEDGHPEHREEPRQDRDAWTVLKGVGALPDSIREDQGQEQVDRDDAELGEPEDMEVGSKGQGTATHQAVPPIGGGLGTGG